MHKTYVYRLFPNNFQRARLQSILDGCRWVYNKTLEIRKAAWEEEQKSISRFETNKLLTAWRAEHAFLANGHAQAMQDAQKRLDLAFSAFFRRVKAGEKPGYPRFRGHERYDSFTYPQENRNWRFLENGRLRLSKVGDLKIRLHRPIMGTIKTLTIRRDSVGNWYACFSCVVETKLLPATDKVVGVDVGLSHFATLSNGEQIENPRFFRQDEKALAAVQRRLSKETKGTPQFRHRKRAVNHVHRRIAHRRQNFAHQQARRIINQYQMVAFEKLDIGAMQEGHQRGLNKSIADVAWNQFVQCCASKAEEAGRAVVLVDPRNTTKACSVCGELVPKALAQRLHDCPRCGLILDRDHNAALNILARGLASMGTQSLEVPIFQVGA